jgi:hypothetical protein
MTFLWHVASEKARALFPLSPHGISPRLNNLGLTPQALRFHRVAVGEAGSRSKNLEIPGIQAPKAALDGGPLLSFGARARIISVETVRPDRAELT